MKISEHQKVITQSMKIAETHSIKMNTRINIGDTSSLLDSF